MMLSKCKWFNGHQAACSLMIDDLVPAAVSLDGTLGPHNDWGFLMDGPDSLFTFFKRNLLEKYPEIRGTFFMPLESQKSIREENGYVVFRRNVDDEFLAFARKYAGLFELAFHGFKHTFVKDHQRFFEFENLGREEIEFFEKNIRALSGKGLYFTGGKFPGYRYNDGALAFIGKAGFKWFALNDGMTNRKHDGNGLGYIAQTEIVNVPTNLTGDAFLRPSVRGGAVRKALKRLLRPGRYLDPRVYLEYLYLKGHPITIQEHFQNQGTQGKRQRPNVYDDINSLDQIFALLRPWDIWYAKCSEVGHYFDSYTNTDIVEKNRNEFEIHYHGNWDRPFLSFESDQQILNEISSATPIRGILKNGSYVFNDLQAGTSYSCQ